jgi:drug/metabolite transporter (DMT)-like permease
MNQVVSEAGLESLQYAHSTCSLSKRPVALIYRLKLGFCQQISLAESRRMHPAQASTIFYSRNSRPSPIKRQGKSTLRTGVGATVLSGILFGTTVPTIKLGLGLLPPDLFVALRFSLSSVIVLLFLRRKGWIDWNLLKTRPIWFVGFFNAFGYVLQFQGQRFTTSSDAALIIGTAALMIPVLSWASGSEKIGTKKSLGVLSGFLGASLVVTRGQTVSLGQGQFLGDVLILGTAVTIALVFIYSKDLVAQKGGRTVTGGMILSTSVLLVFAIPIDEGSSINLSLEAVFYVAFLAVVATIGAYYFLMKGLETVSATVSSIILPIEVIVAVGLSVIIFRDPFDIYSGTGALLIVAGVLLVSSSA